MSLIEQNKLIRDAVVAQITPAKPAGADLFAFKKVDASSRDSICVFLDDGEIDNGAGLDIVAANLVVLIITSAALDADDVLDAIAGPIDDAIAADPSLGDVVTLCLPAAWLYDRDTDSQYTALQITYRVEF